MHCYQKPIIVLQWGHLMSKYRKNKRRSGKKQNGMPYIFLIIFFVLSLLISATASAVVGANLASIITAAAANAAVAVAKAASEAAAAMAKIGASIGTFSASTVSNITYNMNSQMSAIKVATAQVSQSAQNLAEVQTVASQKIATARQAIRIQDQVLKVRRSFSPASGQGYKACYVVQENKGLDQAQQHTAIIAATKESETLSAISVKSDLNASVLNKLKISEAEFCATGNPNCTPSALPAADVNGALLFIPANEGSKEQLARNMFRTNVLGVQLDGLKTANQINSPMGQVSYFQSNRMSALLSPAAYSLAYIDAQNTRTIERDGKKYSANELIDQTVSRYYGGTEAKQWQASMIAQEPRGLLVEMARLGGLSVWLDNHMYQQNLRKEANLASILISSATPISSEVSKIGSSNDARSIYQIGSLYK